MNLNKVPQELKELDRWVVWRDETGRKIPYDAKTLNSKASSTNPETWASYDEAMDAFSERYQDADAYTGIGFVLNGDGINGVDIDHCVTNGKPSQESLSLMEHLGASYVEISPSGHGLRAFGIGTPLAQGCKGTWDGLNVELYSNERYLTLTGNTIKNEGALRELNGFESLAYAIRTDKRIDKATGEIVNVPQDKRHAELVRRIITGEVYHDSLRDLAASLIGGGLHPGAVVNHLRGLMDSSESVHDDRWVSRRKQIPDLVSSAKRKYQTIDPFSQDFIKEDEDLFDAMGAVFADELPTEFVPPDELIESVLACRTISVLYGDSNSGKTFFAIDMACAIARGVPWMDRLTEAGLVVYLATESPETVKARVQAYQKYHECVVSNLLIVQVPVNFHEGDVDVNRVIALIKDAEKRTNTTCKLVIGDTLARISAGANENSGTDMGPIMQRFDFLMNALVASVMVIHHSGKDAAKGGRGWSGIRAHIDTEIEVAEKEGIRKAVITKQRALPGKGEEIYFDLHIIEMGLTKWGKVSNTCVVISAQEPDPEIKLNQKLLDYKDVFIQAWNAYGKPVYSDAPYISKQAFKQFLKVHWADKSDRTIENELSQSYPGRLINTLISHEIVAIKDSGWIVIDPAMAFILMRK